LTQAKPALSLISGELNQKRLDLLRAACPTAKDVAVLFNPENPTAARDVAARTRQALDVAERNGVARSRHHDGYGLRGIHDRWHRDAAIDYDHVGRQRGQFRCKRRKA
jgi:hypothetical protein